MRTLAFVCALAAIVFTSADFWKNGARRLAELRDTREETRRVVADALARAKQRGAPPSANELDAARRLATSLQQDADQVEKVWWRGAATAYDYLLPIAARPPPPQPESERERLEQTLVALPAELKAVEGLSAARLGLRAPSLTEPFPTDAATADDQAERTVATRLLLASLRGVHCVVADAALQREGEAPLALRLVGDATVSDAVALYEKLLGESDDAPPRRLERVAFSRRDPRDWPTAAFELAEPPLHVELTVSFEFPRRRAGAPR